MGKFLAFKSQGIVGTDIFYGEFIPDPDNVIIILDQAGKTNLESSVADSLLIIFVRNVSYNTSYNKAFSIQSLIHKKENLFVGVSGVIRNIGFSYTRRLPLYEGEDLRRRHLWSVECFLFNK